MTSSIARLGYQVGVHVLQLVETMDALARNYLSRVLTHATYALSMIHLQLVHLHSDHVYLMTKLLLRKTKGEILRLDKGDKKYVGHLACTVIGKSCCIHSNAKHQPGIALISRTIAWSRYLREVQLSSRDRLRNLRFKSVSEVASMFEIRNDPRTLCLDWKHQLIIPFSIPMIREKAWK